MQEQSQLLRSLSLTEISFYGIGTIVGAGIYVLLGKVVNESGMAKHHIAPSLLGSVHPTTRTPIAATLITGFLVIIFALWLPITTLAKTTSSLILVVFTLVNLSLLVLNCREKNWSVPGLLAPTTGALLCLSFLGFQIWN